MLSRDERMQLGLVDFPNLAQGFGFASGGLFLRPGSLSLSNVEIHSFLNCSKNIDALPNTKFVGESTSNSCVSVKREVLLFDPETDDIIRNLDVKKVIHPSPSQGSSINHLFAQELEESNSPLSNVFNALSAQKKSIIYDSKQNFDFSAGILKPSILKELGLKQDNLNFISEGLKVNFKKDLDFSKLKPKPKNRIINKNKSIVRKCLNSLEESGSISKVNFKPSVISPLNSLPKPNGSPCLIHDLSRFNKFIAHGPKVKHLNIFNLSKNFSSNTFFTKLDLRNAISTSLFILPIGLILVLVLKGNITFLMFSVSGIPQPQIIFSI